MWLGDHLLYRGDGRPERGPWEAWSLLSGLAAVTQRIEMVRRIRDDIDARVQQLLGELVPAGT